ncbi:hypothetical protein BEH94_00475 [Candidatus Altiarchaeales archaeon WOR_SM1_SCG]|nr:hypothetical protein BEH94_00475 [Candidatus Altiarchaeales archaeon WOR_SM1_SCG]
MLLKIKLLRNKFNIKNKTKNFHTMDIDKMDATSIGLWIAKHIIWDETYPRVKKKFGEDPFKKIAGKAIDNILKENEDYVFLLTEIERKIREEDIKDISQFDENYFCDLLEEAKRTKCLEFFKKVKKEYVRIICDEAKKNNPPMSYAIAEISKNKEEVKKLKKIYPEIGKIFDKISKSREESRKEHKEILDEIKGKPEDYDFEEVREQYLEHVLRNYEHLDFRGIPQVKMFLRVKLDDIFVSLNAVPEKYRDIPEMLERDTLLGDKEKPDEDEIEQLRKEERAAGKSEIDVVEKIKEGKNMVILGSPGSGKTTLLKYSAIKSIESKSKTTILLPLREYASEQLKNDVSIMDYIPRYFHLQGFELPDDFFSRLIKSGNCLILFDGLDEVTELSQRKLVAERVEFFINKHSDNNSFIVTSRIVGYREAPLRSDMEHYTVNDFDIEQIRKFVEKWCCAVEMSVIPEDERTPGRIAEAHKKAKKECESMLDAIESNPSVMKLATNPLMLTILSLIYRQGAKLPQHRVELYDLCVKTLLESWDLHRRLHHKFDERTALDLLKPLALWLHDKEHSLATGYELENFLVNKYTEQFGADKRESKKQVEEFISYIRERTGLLDERGRNSFGFMHLTFEEYLAALHLSDGDVSEIFENIKPNLHNPRYKEIILLTSGCLSEQGQKRASDFIRKIYNAESKYEKILHRDLFLAVQCLGDDININYKMRNEILDKFMGIYFSSNNWRLDELCRNLFSSLKGSGSEDYAVDKLIKKLSYENSSVRGSAARALGAMKAEKAVDKLIERLSDENRYVRRKAAEAIGEIKPDKAVDKLIEKLSDEDGTIRRNAVWALGKIKAEKAVDKLIEKLYDKDGDVRRNVAWALGEIQTDKAVDKLIEKLSDKDGGVRWMAGLAIGAIKSEKAVDKLIEKLSDEDSSVQRNAAWALGEIKSRKAVDKLIEKLSDEDSSVRGKVARALGAIKSEKAVDKLIEKLSDEDSFVRRTAAWALGEIKSRKAVDKLIEKLSDEDSSVRGKVARALGAIKSEKAVDNLLKKLSDEKSYVRGKAAEALGMIKSEKAVDNLLKKLSDEKSYVRGKAAEALGMIKSEKAVDKLIEKLSDEDSSVRRNAAWALGEIKPEKAVDKLIEKLSDEDSFVRRNAACALGMIKSEKAVDKLIEKLSDEDSFVRRNAACALGEIKAEKAVDKLIEKLSDKKRDVRMDAARAIGKIKAEKAVDKLIEKLSDEDSFVRSSATHVLGSIGKSNDEVIKALFSALNDEDWFVRTNAFKSLELLVAMEYS